MYEKITALYCRYSHDDGQETENASITHQKSLLKEYAESNGFTNLRYYVDDGYTGTSFSRPDFQRMMEDVENGIIETILVKDMSRFGRNYVLVGQYVELVLPQYHVRVIGITDNYDSYSTENDLFAFESIFAEMYAADISKKVTYAKHTLGMNGVKLKSRPLYGYKLIDNDYTRWAIDEKSAEIVRLIFDMFLNQDMSINSIAKYLRTNKIPTPSAYMGYKYTTVNTSYDWCFQIVRRLLGFQEYCGDTVNFKTKQISYKIKKRLSIPKENWMIFENQHPAIISREDFERAREKLKNISQNAFSTSNERKNDTFFRNKLFCAMCGGKMRRDNAKGKIYFQCKTYLIYDHCQSNHITENDLRRIALDYLKRLHIAIKTDKSAIISKLGLDRMAEMESQISTTENRLNEISGLLKQIYEQKFHGEISDLQFKSESETLSLEKEELLRYLSDVTAKMSMLCKENVSAVKMLDQISSYSESDFDVLTKKMVDTLIEKIVIDKPMGQREKNYGKRIIDIYVYELGNISNLIDVRFKPFSVRIKEIAPQLLLERRCDMANVIETLATKRGSLKNALAEEGTNFQTVIIEVRKEIIIDSIKKGLTIKEIYPLLGYPETSNVYWFSRRFLGLGFNDFYDKIRNDM
ncbi:recombinase family protein [Porcipelethomonas sp.]|uniref:recombinase family protein n=1 Tax=Porcipelethomonas sp. TaxID=2981675 RepID=UPI003EF49923